MSLDSLVGLGVLSFWIVLLLRLPDVVRPGAFRNMYLAIVALGLSVTLYYRPVALLVADVFGSARPCNVGMNLWGMLTSGVVLALVARELRPALTRAVYALTVVVIALVAVLSYTISKDSVGCVTTLDLPWWDLYWWVIAPVWIIAGTAAVALCVRNFRPAAGDGALVGALGFYLAGFVSSLGFWLGIFGFLLFRPVWVLSWLPVLLCVHIWAFAIGLLVGLVAPALDAARELPEMWRRWRLWRRLDDITARIATERRSTGTGLWLDYLRNPKLGVYRAGVQALDTLVIIDEYTAARDGSPETKEGRMADRIAAYAASPDCSGEDGEIDFKALARYVRDLDKEADHAGV